MVHTELCVCCTAMNVTSAIGWPISPVSPVGWPKLCKILPNHFSTTSVQLCMVLRTPFKAMAIAISSCYQAETANTCTCSH